MNKLKPLSAIIALSVGLPAMPSFAASTLEEIIVTARKRMETIQDIPVSVTAYTGDQLEKAGITEFKDLGLNNPNVKISGGPTGSGIATTVAIRGNLQNDVTFQLDPAVGTYIDDMIIARTFATKSSMMDVENVQTLKGPQGTLFGRNTTGGALVIKTVEPDTSMGFSGKVGAEYGEDGKMGAEVAANIPVSDSVALRVSAIHTERDGYVFDMDGNEYGDIDADAVRVKVLWEISEVTSLLVSAESVDESGTAAMNVGTSPNKPIYHNVPETVVGPPPTPTFSIYESTEENAAEAETYNLRLSHETEWGELKFLTGYRKLDVEIEQSLPPFSGHTVQDKPDNTQFSAEFQLNGSFFDEKLDVTSGVYFFDEETNEVQDTFTPVFAGGTQRSASTMKTNIESMSAYIQASYPLADETNLTLGARYTADDREVNGTYSFDSSGTFVTIPSLVYDDDESKFNYLVSVDHRFSDGLMVYANTSTGYRSGAAAIQPSATAPGQWESVDSEEITNYELGFKSDLLENRLRINGALFYQDYENYQYSAIRAAPGGLTRVGVSNDAIIQGGELEVNLLLPLEITLTAGVGYTHSEIENDSGAASDGHELPVIPRSQYNIGLSKAFELDFGELNLQANYDWQRKYFTSLDDGTFNNEELSMVDDRGLLNLSATLESGAWIATAYVKNATDEEYYNGRTFAQVPTGATTKQTVLDFASIGEPRMAGLKVSYNF